VLACSLLCCGLVENRQQMVRGGGDSGAGQQSGAGSKETNPAGV
jgi:hypothetical protein